MRRITHVILLVLASTAACDRSESEHDGCVHDGECKFDRVCSASMCREPGSDAGSSGGPSWDDESTSWGDGTSWGESTSWGDGTTYYGDSSSASWSSTGDTCECSDDADCGPAGVCIGCVCIDDGGSECTAPSCDACGVCESCLSCAQGGGGACQGANQDCNANTECLALLSCANACADAACVDQCAAEHPAGEADFNALLNCLFAAGGACAGSCG